MPSLIRTHTAAALALAAALLLATAACIGSNGDDATETPSPTPDPALEARARSYLLTLEDFPDGWTQEPQEPDTDYPDYPGDIPSECQSYIEEEELPGTLIEVESDTFHPNPGPRVSSDATIMQDSRFAADAFFLVRRLIRDCADTFANVLKFYIEHDLMTEQDEGTPATDGDITILETSYEELPFLTYGDETLATRFSVLVQSDTTFPLWVDVISIRVGDAIASFSYTYTLVPSDLEHHQELAATLEQKLQSSAP